MEHCYNEHHGICIKVFSIVVVGCGEQRITLYCNGPKNVFIIIDFILVMLGIASFCCIVCPEGKDPADTTDLLSRTKPILT